MVRDGAKLARDRIHVGTMGIWTGMFAKEREREDKQREVANVVSVPLDLCCDRGTRKREVGVGVRRGTRSQVWELN